MKFVVTLCTILFIAAVQAHSLGTQSPLPTLTVPDDTLPKIVSFPKTAAFVDSWFSYQVSASGTPAPTYSLRTSPPGMTIDPADGLILWKPAADQLGSHNVTVRAENTLGFDEQNFTIVVQPAAVPPKITSTPPTEAIAKSNYVYQLSASGTPVPQFRLDAAPTGMMLDAGRGKLTWTPTGAQAGSHDVRVTAFNVGGEDTQSFQIVVYSPPKFTPFPTEFTAFVDSLFHYAFSADGYPTPSYRIISAPNGAGIDTTSGAFTWTPTLQQVGSHTITIETMNRAGSQTLSFTVTVQQTTGISFPDATLMNILGNGYPNPVNAGVDRVLTFPLRISTPTALACRVWDNLGRMVFELPGRTFIAGTHRMEIPVASFPTGMYCVEIRDGAVSITRSFLVVR